MKAVLPDGLETMQACEQQDRMTQATYADGSITTYAYNAIGQPIESQLADANGIRTWTYCHC